MTEEKIASVIRTAVAEQIEHEFRNGKQKPKVGLEWKTLGAIFLGFLTAAGTIAGLMTTIYMTRGDASSLHDAIVSKHDRELQAHVEKAGHRESLVRQDAADRERAKTLKQVSETHDIVIRLGERFNIRTQEEP